MVVAEIPHSHAFSIITLCSSWDLPNCCTKPLISPAPGKAPAKASWNLSCMGRKRRMGSSIDLLPTCKKRLKSS